MYFELTVKIHRTPADVFAFLRDKDLYVQEPDSPVLLLEKTTAGPAGVGTCYREIVQMLPFIRGVICSTITRYEPPAYLEEDFEGAGMVGHLSYHFAENSTGTLLIQQEIIEWQGGLRLLSPVIKPMLEKQLRERLDDIKRILETGYEPPSRGFLVHPS